MSFLLANRPVSRTVLFPIAVIPNKVDGQQNNSGHDSDNINSIHRKTSFIICLAVAEPGPIPPEEVPQAVTAAQSCPVSAIRIEE